MTGQLQIPHAVLFDVGDTILAERRFDLEAGIAAVVEDRCAATALASAFRSELATSHRRGSELLLAAWLQERVPALASTALPVLEDAIWDRVVTLVPRPGIAAVLRLLSRDGVPAAAVSNAAFSGRVLRAELARHGLADRLRFVLSSADLSVRKPSSAIFEAAVGRLDVRAARIWFVGDTFAEDVTGAGAAGLQPIWFSGSDTAEAAFDGLPTVRDWAEFTALYLSAYNGALNGRGDR